MYKITLEYRTGDTYITRILHEASNPNLVVSDATLTRETNYCGKLVFGIDISHPYYDAVGAGVCIRVYINDIEKFRGEIDEDVGEIFGHKTISVLGILSKTSGTIQPYRTEINEPISTYLEWALTNHNEQIVDDRYKLQMGVVTVTDPNDNIYRQSHYETTNELLSDKLVAILGGFLNVRYEGENAYLDYIADYTTKNTQRIKFTENLLEFSYDKRHNEVYTGVYPLGAKLSDETEERVTISEVNNGLPYIIDESIEKIYGRRLYRPKYDDITLPTNLLSRAKSDLENYGSLYTHIEVNALDSNMIDGVAYEKIDVGQHADIVHSLYNLDETALVTKVVDNISNPSESTIYLGKIIKTFTENNALTDKIIESIQDDVGATSTSLESLEQSVASVEQNVEQKLTVSQWALWFTETVNNAVATSVKFTMDKLGLHVEGGGIDISNNAGQKVFYADTDGNLVMKGEIDAGSGEIGGWEITDNALVSPNGTKIQSDGITNIYTYGDLGVMQQIILGAIEPNNAMINHYDFNGDGKITSADYVILRNQLVAL